MFKQWLRAYKQWLRAYDYNMETCPIRLMHRKHICHLRASPSLLHSPPHRSNEGSDTKKATNNIPLIRTDRKNCVKKPLAAPNFRGRLDRVGHVRSRTRPPCRTRAQLDPLDSVVYQNATELSSLLPRYRCCSRCS